MSNTIKQGFRPHNATTERYPMEYDAMSKFSYTGYKMSEWMDIGQCDDRYAMEYKFIRENRNEIIEMFNNDEYDKIKELLKELNVVENNESLIFDNGIFNLLNSDDDNQYVEEDFKNDGELSKIYVSNILLYYSEKYDDNELFKIVVLKNKDFPFGNLLIKIIRNNKQQMFRIILENYNFDEEIFSDIHNSVISFGKNEMMFLEILEKKGLKMNVNDIINAIVRDKINVVEFAIKNDYNMQNIIDENLCKRKQFMCPCSVRMVKLFIDNDISILTNLNDIFFSNIMLGNLDSVEFLVETFECDINSGLDVCCRNKNSSIMIYLLKNGADINTITPNAVLNTDINIMKILIDHNYPVHQNALDIFLIKQFTLDKELDNVYYLIKNGANVHYLFEYDKNNAKNNNIELKKSTVMTGRWEWVNSPLEFIVTDGKFNIIKFLADDYLNELRPELNRLFAIAVANGRLDIAGYLIDLGAIYDDKLLLVACFFGHLQMINFLLKLGTNFNNVDDVFSIMLDGKFCRDKPSKTYTNIILTDMFRNDMYNYGDEYVNILRLLLVCNVNKPDWRFLERLPIEFYEIDIFIHFISNDTNTVENFRGQHLLVKSISNRKMDMIKFLLQYMSEQKSDKLDESILTEELITVININKDEELKNLLKSYGIDI